MQFHPSKTQSDIDFIPKITRNSSIIIIISSGDTPRSKDPRTSLRCGQR
uniref:Uncharacterized protein n=1 Tax=Anguilla anguilla TaxID=7936 RepID=A0A0E9SC47_ANGAN